MATTIVSAGKRRSPGGAERQLAPVPGIVDETVPSAPQTSLSPDRHAWHGNVQPVDELNVEESIKAKAIGDRIRRLRLKRSMGLVELGHRTGMSASFLSQLETGRVVPTLRNLSRIALVFGKDLSHFLVDDKRNQFKKSSAKDRIRLPLGDKSSPVLISESMGALIPDRSLVPCIADFLPVANSSTFEPSTFYGQELVYVLSGQLNITTESDRQKLDADDLAWIDGQLKRKYFCSPGKPARAMIISCPRKD